MALTFMAVLFQPGYLPALIEGWLCMAYSLRPFPGSGAARKESRNFTGGTTEVAWARKLNEEIDRRKLADSGEKSVNNG